MPLDLTYGEFAGSNMWNSPNPRVEDCLFLNVWVPKSENKKRAVMVGKNRVALRSYIIWNFSYLTYFHIYIFLILLRCGFMAVDFSVAVTLYGYMMERL